jgi:superfamily I DNA/RNA helicase
MARGLSESFKLDEGTNRHGIHTELIFQGDEVVQKQSFDASPILEAAKAERIATEIVERRLRYGCGYRDFAVLYRGNHQSRAIEMKLQAYQVPYKLSGGQSCFGRHEIKYIMGYLRLIINPADDAAFLRIINTPRREIGPGTIEKLGEYAAMRGTSMLSAIEPSSPSASIALLAMRSPRKARRSRETCFGWIPMCSASSSVVGSRLNRLGACSSATTLRRATR